MKDKRLLLALLLLLVAFLLLFSKENGKSGYSRFSSYSKVSEEMKQTDLKLQLHEAHTQALADELSEQATEPYAPVLHTGRKALRLKQEAREKEIAEDNRRNDLPSDYRSKNLDELLRQQIADRKFAQQYDESYKRAYIKAFLQNARESGYDIVLNEDLEVISVQPYNEDEPIRFPNSVGPADSRAGK